MPQAENAIMQLFRGLKKSIGIVYHCFQNFNHIFCRCVLTLLKSHCKFFFLDECVKCQNMLSNEESFIVLEIPLSIGTQSVQEAIENYLIGPTDKSSCEACGECENVRFIELTAMPPVLCLHFLR